MMNMKNANFSELQGKLPEAIKKHPLFNRELPNQKQGEWRFRMRLSDEDDRNVDVHVFLFDFSARPI